ncbi:GNAT family N-acetyltransferase [Mollicutes bacterium LVI A0039]|nr:GNAT family N-acetyltransferase [Mollicutes bacterium LVI A0039]
MNNFKIRNAEVKDAKQLIDYLNLIGGESDFLTFGENEFQLSIAEKEGFIKSVDNSNNIYLVATVNDKIVGTICSSIYDNQRFKHNINFDVTVLTEYQKQGIGKALLEQFIDITVANKEIANIVIEVRGDNSSAIKLYEELGFKKVGEIPDNFKSNDQLYSLCIYHLKV